MEGVEVNSKENPNKEITAAVGGVSGDTDRDEEKKAKLVVVMGATGAGKSRLAIDLASYFPVEIINADSMQVYRGLEVLTNKVPLYDQKGVPHHLLGTIMPNVEFTSKDFRDSAIPIINDVLTRDQLPVIVGGTNYYIQALLSPFLLDDVTEALDEYCLNDIVGEKPLDYKVDLTGDNLSNFNRLKELDPDSANRIHPNDHRKVNHYLSLYAHHSVLPSKLFQGKAAERWGRVDDFRYDCCFICVDASLPVLDQYVEQRVDQMIGAGLLKEVYDIYSPNADYTRGLRQAIGVREFEDFLRVHKMETSYSQTTDKGFVSPAGPSSTIPTYRNCDMLLENFMAVLNSSDDNPQKFLLKEAIDRVKMNTRRLVRRQKRRLSRLQAFFGWDLHYVDATEALDCSSDESWHKQVVQPAVNIIKSFWSQDRSSGLKSETLNGNERQKFVPRDLWTQYICEACGNRVLRGAHEWEQHKQGRGHRKRIVRLKKSQSSCLLEDQLPGSE
ncbi:tRNA dimethylallyltransferase 2 isoform X2 [Telopea speciosissima]|uniref:tRNA dimethylallyltransferase 2 isoform X1 n=1 Tax=Telopea speciosissima TaxID=54955 RepID=UPI001CC4E96C|nr:tRNA dimethylallyltransferase 2 isoform X1 [Telopea speciosissima]XP_043702806.1 tRNA dimethylallyltransferase 2 isoform X2 [Telopea speciosissima]